MEKVVAVFNAARKFLVALLGAVLVLLQQLDVAIPQQAWITTAIAAVTSALVWLVPNVTPVAKRSP